MYDKKYSKLEGDEEFLQVKKRKSFNNFILYSLNI